ncbi:MAG: prepilin-type N-terminal cleavage/methylation domain-containing protein [Candidatus Omnitrophota bacterium]
MNRKGFTLVEIMIVVAIIGLLAAIAIPNFVRARTRAQQEACIANLKQIEGAIQVWAVDTGQAETATPAWSALTPTYIRTKPSCPSAGATAYDTLPAVSGRPTCSAGGTHVLP